MIVFFSFLLTTYSQISTLILGITIFTILIHLTKITLAEGEEALTEIRNKEKK